MHTLETLGRSFGPYEAIVHSDGSTEGDIRPILYDTAIIDLKDENKSFSLGYKTSKNLFGKELSYAEIIDMQTGDTFSLQVSNIFLVKVVNGDPKILVKIGEELKWYENFGRTEYKIEADGDKKEVTPLGYFDMFVRFDDDYYYPVILDETKRSQANVKKFYDYYGFKSYTDDNGGDHFLLLIEAENSTEERPVWFWTDNFRKSTDILEFGDESEYVEEWEIDSDGRISMVLTSGAKWHVNENGNMVRGELPMKKTNEFAYTRFFEDTDASVIIGKNINGLFLMERNKTSLSEREQNTIVYFEDFLACYKNGESPFFLIKTKAGDVVIINRDGTEILTTDLSGSEEIAAFAYENNSTYSVQVK